MYVAGATLIAANRSARDARLNRKPDVAAIGDAGQFLTSLAEQAPMHGQQSLSRWTGWIDVLRARDVAREAEIDQQAAARGEFVNPIALLRALEHEARRRRTAGGRRGRLRRHGQLRAAPRAARSHGSIPAPSAPWASGRALRSAPPPPGPTREVWIVFGDGACGWSLAEFDTFVRHGIPVIAIVGNDAGWTQIAREQVKMLHDDVATVLARTAYHDVARGFGAEGLLVMRGDEVVPHSSARVSWRGRAIRCW